MSGSVEKQLATALGRFGVAARVGSKLSVLLELLAEPEAPTAVHDPKRGVDVHIADSLVAVEVPQVRAARLIADLGAGAGLPGLVLAAALPDAHVVLVEASARKCDFMRAAVGAMQLTNAEVAWSRAEEWGEGLGRCDMVTARALAALPVLCEYAAPLLCDGGGLVAWKGAVSSTEAEDAHAAAAHLGLTAEPVRSVVPYPGSQRRTLHAFRKVAPTPPTYPRRAGIATKRPLSAANLR